MDWIKVKVKHAEYDFATAPADVFKAWVMTMIFVAATERIPTPAQLSSRLGKDNYESLLKYIDDNKLTSLDIIIEKVMEDVGVINNRRNHERKYMSEYRCKVLHKPLHNTLPDASTDVKIREDKRRVYIDRFDPPAIETVRNYCLDRKNGVNAEAFVNHYQAKGWMIGKNKMKDWQAAVRTWESKEAPKKVMNKL